MGLLTRFKKTRFNSLLSIWYCLAVVGLHIYITYVDVTSYQRGQGRDWGGAEPPAQLSTTLALIVISMLLLPLFCIACVFKIGNYPNDGVKFGRDNVPTSTTDPSTSRPRFEWVVNLWKHFCPVAQTLHVVMAFMLLMPETLLTSALIQHGYKTSDHIWTTDLDLLFPAHRVTKSHLLASGSYNETLFLAEVRAKTTYNNSAPSVAFGNFAVALVVFSVRFSAVYWYTNKILSCLFALVLLGMSINSVFAFSAFRILYKATLNHKRYPGVITESLSATTVAVLYSISGLITLLSTITIFEYGFYFFHEKFKMSDNKKNRNLVKQTVVVFATCRGYVPHIFALVSMVTLFMFKGPLVYNYSEIYRTTRDGLLLGSIICEVSFMMIWIIMWISLTVKQQWHFRILDYQKVDDPVFTVENNADKARPRKTNNNNSNSNAQYDVPRKVQNQPVPQSAMNEYVMVGHRSDDEQSDLQISERRSPRNVDDITVDDIDPSNPVIINGVLIRKTKNRRSNAGQRVTFSENVKTNSLTDEGLYGRPQLSRSESENAPHLIRAQVHGRRRNSDPSIMDGEPNYGYIVNMNQNGDANQNPNPNHSFKTINVVDSNPNDSANRTYSLPTPESRDTTLDRDYRKNIRSKCDEYYMELGSAGSVCSSENMSPRDVVSSLGTDITKRLSNSSHMSDLSSVSSRPSVMSDQSRTNHNNQNYQFLRLNPLFLKAQSPDRSRDSPLSETSDLGGSKLSSDSPLTTTNLRPLEIRINNSPAGNFTNNSSHNSSIRLSPTTKTEHYVRRTESQPVRLKVNKQQIVRRDSANYSMSSSSQETSSNDSETGGGLCSQV